MSFVITLYVREGIVLAADSRLTLQTQEQKPGGVVINLAVGQSDSNYKLFSSSRGIGLATYGAADIAGVPIAGYIETFLREVVDGNSLEIDQIPDELVAYFSTFSPVPDTGFLVAGYKQAGASVEQQVWRVALSNSSKEMLNKGGNYGASWGGESDILAGLVQPVATLDQAGNIAQKLPTFGVPWQFFTLQDAIDFAVFALRSTIEAIRFLPRAKTVGGPIDVLVIKPGATEWVQRKQLHGEG